MMDDLISRQAAIDAINTWPKFGLDGYGHMVPWNEGLVPYVHLEDVMQAIKNMPTEQPETNSSEFPNSSTLQPTCNQLATDCISRQAAIDALDVLCQEHRYKIPGKGETYSEYNEAWQDALDRAEGIIFNLPSAQPEPCNDAISRQATLNCFHSWVDKHGDVHEADEMEEYKAIEALPSVQPERKTGHWIQYDKRFPWRFHYKCSECGNYLDFSGVNAGRGDANYCPNCGADMRG